MNPTFVLKQTADPGSVKIFLRNRAILQANSPACWNEMSNVKTGRGNATYGDAQNTKKFSTRKGNFLGYEGMKEQEFTILVFRWSHETV